MWFKNLAEPDPYYILPFGLAMSTFLAIHKSPAASQYTGPLSKFSRYMKYTTFFTVPISSTFPSAIVLNWFVMSAFQLSCNILVYSSRGRKLMRIPDFLPGTHLEKIYERQTVEVVKPKIYSKKELKLKNNQ